MIKYLLIYLCILNLLGFFLMFLDKSRARRNQWRIPEKTLFLVSLFGGSLGSWLGMYVFHHKTRHWYFVIGMPLIFIGHMALAYLLIHSLGA